MGVCVPAEEERNYSPTVFTTSTMDRASVQLMCYLPEAQDSAACAISGWEHTGMNAIGSVQKLREDYGESATQEEWHSEGM